MMPLQVIAPTAPPTAPPGAPMGGSSGLTGLIFPPSDIRGIVEKTAQFVAKNGPEFEQRVLADQSNSHKFSFLLPGNPYRPYYDAKVQEFRTGGVNEATQIKMPQAILERQKREAEKKQKKEQLLALAAYSEDAAQALVPLFGGRRAGEGVLATSQQGEQAVDERPPEPPPEDQFDVGHPYAAPLDIDVIKLTAQFVARNGQKFLVGLGQRERGNPQFAFLRGTHPLFPYFTNLIEAYSRCLTPERATLTRLKEDAGGGALQGMLHRVHERFRWEAHEERRKAEQEKRETEERELMQSMDWHDFVVVEIIEFTPEDDMLPLGAPINKAVLTGPTYIPPLAADTLVNEVNAAVGPEGLSLLGQLQGATPVPPAPSFDQTIPTLPTDTSRSSLYHPPPTSTSAFSGPPPAPSTSLESGSAPVSSAAPPSNSSIVVVKDYVRQGRQKRLRAAAESSGATATVSASGMQKCPITGQMVPTERMTEHLRVVLLEPKWKEQKDAVLEKARKGSALVDGFDFGANLAEFVVNRPDLFGTVEDEVEGAYVATVAPAPKRK